MLGMVLGTEDATVMIHTHLRQTEAVMSVPKEMKGETKGWGHLSSSGQERLPFEEGQLRVELDSPPVLRQQEAGKPPKAPRWERYCAFQGHEEN